MLNMRGGGGEGGMLTEIYQAGMESNYYIKRTCTVLRFPGFWYFCPALYLRVTS